MTVPGGILRIIDANLNRMGEGLRVLEELARLSGVELGEVLSVSEVVGSTPMVMRDEAAMAYGGGGIAPGELEFSTQIQVTFAIQ